MNRTSSKVAVITGAGSGIGQAIALKLVREGWSAALIGRRESALRETIALASGDEQDRLHPFPCDAGDPTAVKAMKAAVFAQFSRVDALIYAAGTNVARRSLSELDQEDYRSLLAANIDGVFFCTQAFISDMRSRREGTFIFINSEAGLRAFDKSGVAYVISKFGMTGFAQYLRDTESSHGIRVTTIYPGDVNTPLLQKRPVTPPPEACAAMVQPEEVAECAWLALSFKSTTVIRDLTIAPRGICS